MRDPGSTICIVAKELVPNDQYTGQTYSISLMDGSTVYAPEAEVNCATTYITGKVKVAVIDNPIHKFIVGNVRGVKDWTPPPVLDCSTQTDIQNFATEEFSAATTRSMAKNAPRAGKPLQVASIDNLVNFTEIAKDQLQDPTLEKLWKYAAEHKIFGSPQEHVFKIENGRLYRVVTIAPNEYMKQLVVPQPLRAAVCKLGHESPLAGHMGTKKSLDRIKAHFFWPAMGVEIARFCRSCDRCQRTSDKGRIKPVPLQPLPVISEPFLQVAVDLVGPLKPAARDGSRYILTVVDFATRWPEAIALKNIETTNIAEALMSIFCRMGVPNKVLSDRGTQFVSNIMKEVYRLMSIRPLYTPPYHPQGNGMCERMNGCLKKMLRRMCQEQPKEWPRFLNPLLFAYREAPQSSLGFSPFELMFGREVKGPLSILRELWDGEEVTLEEKTSFQYVIDLETRLEKTCQIAREELTKAKLTDKKYFDKKAKERNLKVGDKCLVLLPTSTNKLLAQWSGPFPVSEVCTPRIYKIKIRGQEKKFHINMLKKYLEREKCSAVQGSLLVSRSQEQERLLDLVRGHYDPGNCIKAICSAVITEDDDDNQPMTIKMDRKECHKDAKINEDLPESARKELLHIINKFDHIFSDTPGCARVEPYCINVSDLTPIRSRPYHIPFKLQEKVKKELEMMEAAGFIEPSTSSYCSPMVVVEKGDKVRICGDYRKINAVIDFEAEPMADPEVIFSKLANSVYFSKLDLTRGFFQLPLHPKSRKYTAFATPDGVKQYTVLPFGLTTSPAAFNRVMRKVLKDIENVEIFVDDILIHNTSWEDHLKTIKIVCEILSAYNFTIKPSKCMLAQTSVDFLGHVIGGGIKRCQSSKIEKIWNARPPTTKKLVQSFLGLVNYYRDYIQDYSSIACPLYDLTRKSSPKVVKWESIHQVAFDKLKRAICKDPILRLPDATKPYIIRTDASNTGVGAILLQEYENGMWPIAYYSKKLKGSQINYSTIEKELLSIVLGIKRFYNYVYGDEFILETDHLPLQYLQAAKGTNQRLMRWSLFLQQYRFHVKYIKGNLNIGADFLSRLE